MIRTALLVTLVVLCTACGGSNEAPPPPIEPASWIPGCKAPHHQVLALTETQTKKTLVMVALDNRTLRIQSIMDGTLIIADVTTGIQVGVVAATPHGEAKLDETTIPTSCLVVLSVTDGKVTSTTISTDITGKSDKDLAQLLP